MSSYRVEPFDGPPESWDDLVEDSNEGTLFHRMDFLAYHGDRFADQEHHLGIYKGQALKGVLPLAITEEEGLRVARSPFGASYGGPALREVLAYRHAHRVVESLLDHLASLEVDRAVMTLPIRACYRRYDDTFRLVLHEHGFEVVNRDVSSVVDLDPQMSAEDQVDKDARNAARRAHRSGVETKQDASTDDFWEVLRRTLDKHGTDPTHTGEEWSWLREHLPDRVTCDVAYHDGDPVAGIGRMEVNARLTASFYFAQDPERRDLNGLTLLILEDLERCRQRGVPWYDFGTSSVDMEGRGNIFRFKESFGALGQFRETYELDMNAGGASA